MRIPRSADTVLIQLEPLIPAQGASSTLKYVLTASLARAEEEWRPDPHLVSLDPTSPSSQVLSHPPRSPSPSSPFTDPDAPSFPRPTRPSPLPHAAVSTPALSGRGTGKGRFGGMGEMGARSEERHKTSQSFGGGPNEGFIQCVLRLSSLLHVGADTTGSMINTLALDEPAEVSEGSEEDSFASTTLSSSLSEPHSSEDEGPPSFLSPLPTTAEPEDTQDMTSSIYAIHRPIAARRRTVTGEAGEFVKEGRYAAQRERSETTDTTDSSKSTTRRQKLAEKLEDVFGIDGGEEVLAGEFWSCTSVTRLLMGICAAEFPCWLFRSVLLQGFMYLTTGHICFYAYLPHTEVSPCEAEGRT